MRLTFHGIHATVFAALLNTLCLYPHEMFSSAQTLISEDQDRQVHRVSYRQDERGEAADKVSRLYIWDHFHLAFRIFVKQTLLQVSVHQVLSAQTLAWILGDSFHRFEKSLRHDVQGYHTKLVDTALTYFAESVFLCIHSLEFFAALTQAQVISDTTLW